MLSSQTTSTITRKLFDTQKTFRVQTGLVLLTHRLLAGIGENYNKSVLTLNSSPVKFNLSGRTRPLPISLGLVFLRKTSFLYNCSQTSSAVLQLWSASYILPFYNKFLIIVLFLSVTTGRCLSTARDKAQVCKRFHTSYFNLPPTYVTYPFLM